MPDVRNPGNDSGGLTSLAADVARLTAMLQSAEVRTEGSIDTLAQAIEVLVKRHDQHERALARTNESERLRVDTQFEKQSEAFRVSSEQAARDGRDQIRSLYSRLDEQQARHDRDRKTPWAPVGIACSALFAVGGMALSGVLALVGIFGQQYSKDLDRIEHDQEILTKTVISRIQEGRYDKGIQDAFRARAEAEFNQIIEWNRRQSDRLNWLNSEVAKQGERDRLGEGPTFERLGDK